MAKKSEKNDGLLKLFQTIDWKKWLITGIVVFVCVTLLDFFVHGVLLAKIYGTQTGLFLPADVMQARMPFLVLSQVLFTLIFVLIYSQGYTGKGSVTEGIRYGIYIGLLLNLPMIPSNYFMSKTPMFLIYAWAGLNFVQCIIYGAVTGALYKK